ncbi:MAG: Ku protein, partial [Methylophilaceae bacterium]
ARGGAKVYVLLRETLKRAGKVGIAQVVIRTKQHVAALLPMDKAIVLNLLRYHDELRSTDDLELPDAKDKKAAVTDKEVQMALSLLEDMTEAWHPEQYHDTYRDDVMALVDKKVEGKQTHALTEPEAGEEHAPSSAKVIDLMELLKKSIGSKDKKPMRAANEEDAGETAPPKSTSHRRKAAAPAAAAAKRASTGGKGSSRPSGGTTRKAA